MEIVQKSVHLFGLSMLKKKNDCGFDEWGSRISERNSSLYGNHTRQSTLHVLLGTRDNRETTSHWFPNGMYTVKQNPSYEFGRI